MMLALGAGSLAAGMFHLFTHAFFKALLFLCAGSVIHSVGTNDITEMGGLRKVMPRTYWTMLIGGAVAVGHSAAGRVLVERRGPERGRDGRRADPAGVRRDHGLSDRLLHLPHVLPDLPRRVPRAGSRGCRSGRIRPSSTPRPTRAAARVRLVDDRAADRAGDSGAGHRLLGLAVRATTASSASWRARLSWRSRRTWRWRRSARCWRSLASAWRG